MHVVVLGAGVTGVTTAYYLAERGHTVTLIDAADEVAARTSYANAAQLSYSHTDALAQPGFPLRIPGLMVGADPAIRIGWARNHALMPWGLRFLRECTSARAGANTAAVLDTALESAKLLQELRQQVGLEFHWRRAGKLAIISKDKDVAPARRRAELKRERGCEVQVIDRDEALGLEPALERMQPAIAAAVYSPNDEVGDAHAFCRGLAAWLKEHRDVDVRLGLKVDSLVVSGKRLAAVRTSSGDVQSDAVAVCLGPWSAALLRPLGIAPHIYPVRGYSLPLPLGAATPAVSVTHSEQRIVFSRLGDRVRVAGFADFLGYDTRRDTARQRDLLQVARRVAPHAADYDAAVAHAWGGFRPVTPDSRPRVGATKIQGLYLNTGHGVLGWTLACATANRLAKAMA